MKTMCSTIFSFEQGIPKELTASSLEALEISTKHFKDGQHSLAWNFRKGDKLQVNHSIGYRDFDPNSKSQNRSVFSIWIYNEEAIDDYLKFEFSRQDKSEPDCWFSFHLNYTGWRTAWVLFERDMEGEPHEDMNQLIIKAPKTADEGRIYIDQLILSSKIDPRHPTRDAQVPFVNMEADKKANSHWLSLLLFSQYAETASIVLHTNEQMQQEILKIEERYTRYIIERYKPEGEVTLETIQREFDTYDIKEKEGYITGRSIDYIQYHHIYPADQREEMKLLLRTIPVKEYVRFLKKVAIAYHQTSKLEKKEKLEEIFILLVRHLFDQGWSKKSALGTVHHLGYSLRDYYPALFLMKKSLQKKNMQKDVQAAMAWFSGMGRIFHFPEVRKDISMDTLNTQLEGIFVSTLLIEDPAEKVFYIQQFSTWLSDCLQPAEGLAGPFKRDGSVYHHCNLYPAYGIGGLLGVTPIVYFLSGTQFRIESDAHQLLKKAVMHMRLYCNLKQWLISLSARHPKGIGEHSELNTEPFLYMALAGSPDGIQEIDEEVARAYLRLTTESDTWREKLIQLGIEPEDHPQGHWTMNYGALSLHRRDQWLVGVRGHSRYLWGNETYLQANLYGRYITYGQVEILSEGDPVNHRDSGFVQEGWDWNRWPGTTTIHLPWDQLRADVKNLDTHSGFEEMLISDEAFAGGLHIQNQQGMFAMKLHEHPKYYGSHRAIKSVFMFDQYVLCLGSGIENDCKAYPTQTTLFQNHLSTIEESIWVEGEQVLQFPYETKRDMSQSTWLIDNKNNGYYIPAGQKIELRRQVQNSKSQDLGMDTEGNFATAWIDHGYEPKNQSYEYLIVLQPALEEMKTLEDQMKRGQVYEIWQQDQKGHIVYNKKNQITAYALFEPKKDLAADKGRGVIHSVSQPCMMMTKEEDQLMTLSICDPDLRLYEGKDEDQYDQEGNRREVSIYSRKWRLSPSISSKIQVELRGHWQLQGDEKPEVRWVGYDKKQKITILEFTCREGMAVEIQMNQV